jgi:hypothetical protein
LVTVTAVVVEAKKIVGFWQDNSLIVGFDFRESATIWWE